MFSDVFIFPLLFVYDNSFQLSGIILKLDISYCNMSFADIVVWEAMSMSIRAPFLLK